MTRFAALLVLCLVVASASTSAQATSRGGSSVVTFQNGHYQLDGKPFFPVMALVTFCPTADAVDRMVSMGINMIDGYALSCAGTGQSIPQEVQNLENVLRGKVLWMEHDLSVGFYPEGLSELVDWQVPSTTWDNRDGNQLIQCNPTAVADAFTALNNKTGPVVVRIPIAQDSGVDGVNPACLTGKYVNALVATAVAAGADGVEFLPQSRGNANADPSLLFNPPPALPTQVKQQFSRLALVMPAVLNGQRIKTVHASASTVKTGAWRYNGKVFVLGINASATKTANATLTPQGASGSTAQVLGENKAAKMNKGAIAGSFQPLEMHLYRTASATKK